MRALLPGEVFGLIRPSIDAHTLGINHVARLLDAAGYRAVVADESVVTAVNELQVERHQATLVAWLRSEGITRVGLSSRLDPRNAAELLDRLRFVLRRQHMYATPEAPVRGLAFAGLPTACHLVRTTYGDEVATFDGSESPSETLTALGVPPQQIPTDIAITSRYDDERVAFGRRLIARGDFTTIGPEDRSGYPTYATARDCMADRLMHAGHLRQAPLMRAHFGPYGEDREVAVDNFVRQVRDLAQSGQLDVLSIGTSQLTQERFGEDWAGEPNGGGVPINSVAEYQRVAEAAKPMLVRTYAGTSRIPALARIHEQSLNIAWHALSLWWFSRLDGRGPHGVLANLREHLAALDFIAATGKPFEANVPHHFAFRGGDDVTYVVSGVLAARTAKRRGIRHFIVQVMLNTPRHTAGTADLAKARALMALIGRLADENFTVTLQPRAGLDYFSTDELEARAQLAAVTALMDDIAPKDVHSPGIIHVVSYSEGIDLATPAVINESVQITKAALSTYRRLRAAGQILDVDAETDVRQRTAALLADAQTVLDAIDADIDDPYSAEGLHAVLTSGYLAVPYLWQERDEFAAAVRWRTDLVNGGVAIVDDLGRPVSASDRVALAGSLVPPTLRPSLQPDVSAWGAR